MRGLLNIEAILSLMAIAWMVIAWMLRRDVARVSRSESLSWMELSAVLVATLVAFAWTQHFYFLSDDFVLLTQFRAPWPPLSYFFTTPGGDGFFRPIGNILFRLNYAVAGTSPAVWHWTGFLLHAVNAMLVCLIAAELGFSRTGRLFAGLLFAWHGSRPESVVWMAGRFDLFAALFGLLSLYCALRGWGAPSILAMILGVWCKESAYAIPIVLWLLPKPRRRLVAWVSGVCGVLFAWRLVLFAGIGGYASSGSLISAMNALLIRLWAVLVFPINWTQPTVMISVAVLLGGIAVLCMAATQSVRWQYVVLTVAVAAPAISQLAIGSDLQKSRVLYLPVLGLCLLFGERIRAVPAVLFLTAQLFFLEHNLTYWREVSLAVRQACQARTTEAIPNSIDGVYALANGREECVEIVNAVPN